MPNRFKANGQDTKKRLLELADTLRPYQAQFCLNENWTGVVVASSEPIPAEVMARIEPLKAAIAHGLILRVLDELTPEQAAAVLDQFAEKL